MAINSFILSSSSRSKEFTCLSSESNITILNATLIKPETNWQSAIGNAYLEISFSYTDEIDKNKQWSRVQPLNLLINQYQNQPIKSFNIVFTSEYLSNSNNFYDHLSIKLVERNITEPVEWRIEYECNSMIEA
jgi:hypothetical protein